MPNGRLAIIHNSKQHGQVVLDDFQGFSSGKAVSLIDRPPTIESKRQTVSRALSMLDQPYDLIGFNCDHHTSYARTGVAESPQLKGFLVLAGIFTLTGIAIYSEAKK